MCLHHQAAVSSRTLKFLQEKPLADLPRAAVTSPNMVHTQRDPLAVDFVTDNPPLLPPFSLSLCLDLPVTMTTKATLSVSYAQSVHLGGYQPAFSLTYMAAGLFHCHPTRLLRSITWPCFPSHHPLLPPWFLTQKTAPDTRTVFCSRLLNNLATGAGGVNRFMRTLLLMFEVHSVEITAVSTFVLLVLAPSRSRR